MIKYQCDICGAEMEKKHEPLWHYKEYYLCLDVFIKQQQKEGESKKWDRYIDVCDSCSGAFYARLMRSGAMVQEEGESAQ